VYLFSLASGNKGNNTPRSAGGFGPAKKSVLVASIKAGLGIPEEQFLFALCPPGYGVRDVPPEDGGTDGQRKRVIRNAVSVRKEEAEIREDVVVYRPQCLDVGVWEIGGAGVLLRMVELADVSFCFADLGSDFELILCRTRMIFATRLGFLRIR